MLVMLSMVIMVPPLVVTPKKDWDRGYVWEARRGAAVTNSIEKLVVVALGRVGETGFKWHSPSRQDGPIFFEGGGGVEGGGGGTERERNHQSDCWVVSARHIYLI